MPSWIMLPHDGVGRLDADAEERRALSSRMLPAIDRVANTITGPMQVGQQVLRSRIDPSLRPERARGLDEVAAPAATAPRRG